MQTSHKQGSSSAKQGGGLVTTVTVPGIPIYISATSLILVLLLTSAYLMLPVHRPVVTFLAVALTAAGIIASAFYVGRTLQLHLDRYAVERDRESREAAWAIEATTFRYMERWNDPAIWPARDMLRELIETIGPQGTSKISEVLKNDTEKRNKITHVLSFLEEMAICIGTGHVKEDILRKAFEGTVLNSYRYTKNWIDDLRTARGRPKIFIELQTLHDSWISDKKT